MDTVCNWINNQIGIYFGKSGTPEIHGCIEPFYRNLEVDDEVMFPFFSSKVLAINFSESFCNCKQCLNDIVYGHLSK